MAAHVSTQLRNALKSALTGLATTGAHVYADRPESRSLQAAELPGLLIYTGEEVAALDSLDGGILNRTPRLRVGIRVKNTGAIDDTLDQIRKEIEIALAGGLTVAGRNLVAQYTGMSEPSLDDTLDQPVIAAELEFLFEFYTLYNAPDALV